MEKSASIVGHGTTGLNGLRGENKNEFKSKVANYFYLKTDCISRFTSDKRGFMCVPSQVGRKNSTINEMNKKGPADHRTQLISSHACNTRGSGNMKIFLDLNF